MKTSLIVVTAFLAMASAGRVNVVDQNPETVSVVDNNPNTVRVVDPYFYKPGPVINNGQIVDQGFYQPGPVVDGAGQAPPGYHGANGLNYPPSEYYNRGEVQATPQLQQRPANSYKQYSQPGARGGN